MSRKVAGGIPNLDSIILNCLFQLNGERTIYSIFHLLQGKKSSQTIQDAHLFALTKFFGVFPSFTRESLETVIKHALDHNWITPCADQRFLFTNKGEEMLHLYNEEYPVPLYLNGWKYHHIDMQFWGKLSLVVQVISNLVFQKTQYIPIQKNKEIHIWIKTFLKNNHLSRNLLGNALFSELTECLEMDTNLDPSILVFRLTGYNTIGLTPQQAAEKLNMEFTRYNIEFINILHYILQQVTANMNRFSLLYSILTNTKSNKLLTNSSYKTYELLEKGYSIEEIAKYRSLKTGTIEDHIVEIALHIDHFSIDSFIDTQMQKRILAVVKQTSSKQLKLIRSIVESANYFQIRLVLAKYGVRQ